MSQIEKKDIISLVKSFRYGFNGLIFCINNERNMRIHLSVASLVMLFCIFFKPTTTEWAILIITFSIVIVSEMLNTAIEAAVNLGSPSYNPLARIAKDVAAAAVLVAAFMAVIVGIIIFGNPDRLIPPIIEIISSPYWAPMFIVVISAAVLFIFKGVKRQL